MKKRLESLVENSVILGGLRRGIAYLYRLFFRSAYGRTRRIYPNACRAVENGMAVAAADGTAPLRRAVSRRLHNGRFSRFSAYLKDTLISTSCQSYGMIAVSFGIMTALVYLLQLFIDTIPAVYSMRTFVVALTFALFSLILLFFDVPLYRAVSGSRFLRYILIEYLGLSLLVPDNPRRGIPLGRAFLYGAFLSGLALFVTPLRICVILIATILFLLIMDRPEFSLYLSLFLIPLAGIFQNGTLFLVLTVAAGTVSYFGKLLMNKRTLNPAPTDFVILLFILLTFFGGIFSYGGQASFLRAGGCAVLLLGYFLASNLLSGEASFYRFCRLAVTVTAVVSVFAILEYYTGDAVHSWLDDTMFSDISGRVSAFFGNANILSVYLLIGAPLALALMTARRAPGQKFMYFVSFVVILTALTLTWSRGAWIGLFIAVLAFILLYSRRSPVLIPLIAVCLPIGLWFVPQSILSRLASVTALFLPGTSLDSSFSYRISIYRGVLRLLGDFGIGGIGVGDEAFSAVYPLYAPAGAEEAVHAHNLYLQSFCEVGFMGPLLFLILAFLLFVHVVSHHGESRKDRMRILHIGFFSALSGVMVNGMFDYVLYSPRVYYLFFLLVGVTVALGRIGRMRENENSFQQNSHSLYSSVDVTVRK